MTRPITERPAVPPDDPAPEGSDPMTPGLRQLLVVTLAVVSGATDAIGLLVLGGAFTSVMTGNLVILGVSASTTDAALAIASSGAILAFCAGAAIGARVTGAPRSGDPVWPRAVTRGLTVELVLVAGFAAGWWAAGSDPGPALAHTLLFALSGAMGIQSSVVQRFGVPGLSTTYLTGTLTTVVIKLASGRGVRENRASLEILAGLVAGAAAGGGLALFVPVTAPLVQVVPLAAVLLVAVLCTRRRLRTARIPSAP